MKRNATRILAQCCLLSVLVLAGCAGMLTKWECAGPSCLPKYQATNKCLAMANAAFARASTKAEIWAQCMRGEGYQEIRCAEYEAGNPECRFLHVW